MTGTPAAKWDDLRLRIVTASALLVIGGGLIWLGGPWFTFLAAGVAAGIVWELARMIEREPASVALQAALLAFAAILIARALPPVAVLPVIAAAAVAGLSKLTRLRHLFALYAVAIMLGGYALAGFREEHGLAWFAWLVLVVVTTDVMGYFGGRLIGGPKFWPSVSPKKTWAGILCGWAGAAIVGELFVLFGGAGFELIWLTIFVSFAAQLGDIAESYIKRRCDTKDSSQLLPGHGGLWDRFDGLIGAAVAIVLIAIVMPVPEVGGPAPVAGVAD